jgi:hypothetical protein
MLQSDMEVSKMNKTCNHKSIAQHKYALIKGNIFDIALTAVNNNNQSGATIIIPNICNNIGIFKSSLSDELERVFPEVSANFSLAGKLKLGYTQNVTVHQNNLTKNRLIISNIVCENGRPSLKNRRPLHYPSLIKCMYQINDLCDTILASDKKVKIYFTKFGTGLSGGNWNFISDIIDDMWSSYNVNLFIK